MSERQMQEVLRNQQPLTLPPETGVIEACRQMHARQVGAVLVTDGSGALVGIFTGRDAVRVLAEYVSIDNVRLADAMTCNPATMGPRQTAIEALRLMRDGGFRHVPVVREGVVIGVVSRGDFRGIERDRLDEETGLWERIR